MVIRVPFAPFIPAPPYAHGSGQPLLIFVLATLAASRLEQDWVVERVPRASVTRTTYTFPMRELRPLS